MDINIIKDGKYIGYHELSNLPYKSGDIVVIKKGILYRSTKDRNFHVAKRTYKIKINHLMSGVDYLDNGESVIQNPSVVWTGSGGYWHEADINDVIPYKLGE